jgi:aspartyl/glutamyl-tRNA(asn/gln) amidotransferase subunit B
MEEDAGKLTHHDNYSLVDLNRAGTPLIEIVSEPDMHSAAEARAYATELYRLMTYAGVTYGDLYHGNMRFDVNISIAPKGSTTLGKRAEVKNLNSFRSVEHAAQYEFERQVALVEAGEPVVQETRGWNDDRGITTSQRSKEDAQDYRYMPDPDIPPIVLTDEEIADIQAGMPMLPGEYRESWSGLSLDKSVVDTILGHQEVADLLQQTYRLADSDQGGVLSELGVDKQVYAALMRRIFNWFASTPDEMIDLACIRSGLVEPRRLVHLALLAEKNEISSNNAKEIFLFLFDESFAGKMPRDIAKEKNLLQVSDESAIAAIVDDVMNDPASAASIADIKAGKDKAIGYLVGQVMKRSKGQANPSLAQKLIRERL